MKKLFLFLFLLESIVADEITTKSTLLLGNSFQIENAQYVNTNFSAVSGIEISLMDSIFLLSNRYAISSRDSILKKVDIQLNMGIPVIEERVDLFVGYAMGYNESGQWGDSSINSYIDVVIVAPFVFEVFYGFNLTQNSHNVGLSFGIKE